MYIIMLCSKVAYYRFFFPIFLHFACKGYLELLILRSLNVNWMSIADHKSPQRERLHGCFSHIGGWILWLLLKYCTYCVSAPSLHRQFTDSISDNYHIFQHKQTVWKLLCHNIGNEWIVCSPTNVWWKSRNLYQCHAAMDYVLKI